MAKTKVILYNPKAVFFDLPLALLAIGSNVPDHLEVIIIDGRLEDDPRQKIQEHLNDALCFGVTALTGKPIKDALEITRWVKKVKPDLTTIWGGWHTSLFPTETLEQEPSIDITVQGQGEITFREILDTLENGSDLSAVKGICFKSDSGVKKNAARVLEDMNDLPKVNYNLIDLEPYFQKKGKRQFDYITSTGCYFRCAFCADPFVFGRNFSAVDPERVALEIKEQWDKYQFTEVNFQDETLFTYPKRIRKLAEEFLRLEIPISWAGTLRADQAHRMTDEDFALFKKAGLRRVLIGVESGSQEMMDWLKKDIKLEHVYEAADRCKKHGIGVIFPFIVGFPNETQKSLDATVQVVKDLNRMAPNFETPIFYFKPYPGSSITQEVVKNGYKLPTTLDDWAEFDYIGSAGPWVSEEMYTFFERFKFYLKLGYGKKRPWLFPFKAIAQSRIKYNRYSFPIEKNLANWIKPPQQLS